MRKRVFHILGTGHSGSTMLDLILGNSPSGTSIGELSALFRPWHKHHLLNDQSCFCNSSDCMYWSRIKGEGWRKVYSEIFARNQDLDYIIDSSKDALWYRDQLKLSFSLDYDVIPVVIFKTPLEFAYSMHKRGLLGNAISLWNTKYERILKVTGSEFFAISYCDLIKHRDKSIPFLLSSMELDPGLADRSFGSNVHPHFLFGSNSARFSGQMKEYDKLYDPDILSMIKQSYPLENSRSGSLLETLTLCSERPPKQRSTDIKKQVEQLGRMPCSYHLKYRLTRTSSYRFNRTMNLVKDIFKS